MRLPRPALLALASLTCSGLLCLLANGVPRIAPEDAARFEGRDVRVQGLADALRLFPDGWQATLHANGTALLVRGQGAPAFQDGDWVEVEGRVARSAGRLALLAEDAEVAQRNQGPATPGWAAVAENPEAWDHRPLRLAGWAERGELRDRDGHALRLAPGPWPSGAVTVTGFLAYDAACVCHRLHGTAA